MLVKRIRNLRLKIRRFYRRATRSQAVSRQVEGIFASVIRVKSGD
jgi:hypothetical protein